jgi:hypothetical protein
VGALEAAAMLPVGAGEGAALVAEELASNSSAVKALQLTANEGSLVRLLRSWRARATSSLPVPVSPVMMTGASVGA